MKKIVFLLVVCFAFVACSKQDTEVDLNKVGGITSTTLVEELDQLFKKDSVVSRLTASSINIDNRFVAGDDLYLIYKKGGDLLMSLSPDKPLDSLSTIKRVTIFSNDYKTSKGIGVLSSFAELNLNHNIEKIEASFTSVIVYVKDINATFTLDKKDIGLKTFKLGTVEVNQIPDNATFTSMSIWMK